jgi:hypothetical protein
MGVIVIACYRPKPGEEAALRELMKTHVSILRSVGLATARVPIAMEAKDGTILEVFEWVSAEAIEKAHTDPTVLAMWERFGKVCDFVPVGQVPEAADMFASFAPLGA